MSFLQQVNAKYNVVLVVESRISEQVFKQCIKNDNEEWPLFRGHKKTEITPTVKKQETKDPAGIYFFSKKNPSPGEGACDLDAWNEIWEGRLTSSAKVLELHSEFSSPEKIVKILERLGMTESDLTSKIVFSRLAKLGDKIENWQLCSDELGSYETLKELFETRNGGHCFHVIKNMLNDSNKFRQFFLDLGFNVIHDSDAIIWSTEKEQWVVLEPSAVETRPFVMSGT